MANRIWIAIRRDDGTFDFVAPTRMMRFLDGEVAFPVFKDGFVYEVEIVVAVESHRPERVVRMTFHRYKALADGFVDQAEFLDLKRAAVDSIALGARPRSEGMIDATGDFARRRLRGRFGWKPTAAEDRALCVLVNKRAGGQLL